MGRMLYGLLVAALLLSSSCLADHLETDDKPDQDKNLSEREVDWIANGVLEEETRPIHALQLLKVTDPLSIEDEPENDVAPRLSWGQFGSMLMRIGRAVSQATRKKLLSFFRKIRKAASYVINKVTSSAKKVWKKIKSKIPGKLKNKLRKGGKKLVKKVLREVFEEAAELTLEYVQAMVMEYIRSKSEEELCECPMADDPTKCRCCIKPPGFEKACMVVKARPKLQWFAFSFRYNGSEFMKAKIAEDERGPCQKDILDMSRKVCKNLPHYLHFLNMCFVPGSMYATEDGGFVGCFHMHVDSLKLGLERCVLYSPASEGNPASTALFTPDELGLEE